ncbi:hypothetical protein EV356DRAFT_512308 [Viridothelium virens]|uniref:Heterokaryon incompatibility domain-containing protein n=1 Tax=Viridothelium virens TaxID=1048519 RepID=A0A6A6HHV0_VIRVR|nr:hypothetical protein EV356DRAFT_512308 [Viridothelium virens]
MHQPLRADQFRLLRPQRDGQIRTSLEVHDPVKHPSYVALSYTWGRAANRKERPLSAKYSITLCDKEVVVQENLHDALRHLLPVVQRHDGYIFIDALCINQEDIVERSNQVRMMKAIYEGARVVFGWLGIPPNEEEHMQAIALMGRFNLALREGLEKNTDDMDKVTTGLPADNPNLYPVPNTDTYKGWLGLLKIFDNRYWGRTWVQQEATGPPKTFFFCGDQSFDRVYLAAACYFAYHSSLLPAVEQRFARAIGPSDAWRLISMRNLDRTFVREHETELIHLLSTFRNTTCTNSRDKVFAPCNLATDVNHDDVPVDYSGSVQDIYESVVSFYLARYADLGFLGHVSLPVEDSKRMQRECEEDTLPTWIPDWRDRIKVQPPSLLGQTRKQTNPLFCAAGKHGHPVYQISGGKLTVTGMIIDKIISLSPICEEPVDQVTEAKQWTPANASTRREPIDKLDPERYNFRHGFDVVINQVCFGRRLASTEDGFMGIVPDASKTGDTVCVLWGGQTLYVVRAAADSRYQFLGECYMHGLMHGEALEVKPESTAQIIHLI